MTENKAQTLLTDWAMSLVEPDHIPASFEINILAGEFTNLGKNVYRSDIPLYKGGITLQDYRDNIDALLKRELTKLQLEATFLYFAKPRNKHIKVSKSLGCHVDTVRLGIKKSIQLVKALDKSL